LKDAGFRDADEIITKRLGKRNAPAPCHLMIFMRDEHQAIGFEGKCFQPGDIERLTHDADVNHSLGHSTNDLIAPSLFHLNADARVIYQERTERLR
jgi:hypothetical protein